MKSNFSSPQKKFSIITNAQQMILLLLFNNSCKISCKDASSLSGIPLNEILKEASICVNGRNKILRVSGEPKENEKERESNQSTEKSIGENDILEINEEFRFVFFLFLLYKHTIGQKLLLSGLLPWFHNVKHLLKWKKQEWSLKKTEMTCSNFLFFTLNFDLAGLTLALSELWKQNANYNIMISFLKLADILLWDFKWLSQQWKEE